MSRLRLYTVFHANLDFSAIPDQDVPAVVANCYWPLLTLAAEALIPLGIEMPARTLARVRTEDPEWVKTLRELTSRGLIEPVGSGLAQVIGPLIPADVNRASLRIGKQHYEELLGESPTTWFVNEQTWSDGLGVLYGEIGARALVMEWNNPASQRSELRPLRYSPARIRVGSHRTLPLLWNDCILFQKLQRVAHGEIPLREMLDTVGAAHAEHEERRLCVYGGDLEIFDYRPGGPEPLGASRGVEMERLGHTLRTLANDPRFRFVLPRDAAGGPDDGPCVTLSSPAEPIPCKKQPRYNPTRWAVCGRDGFGMNSRCFSLRRIQANAWGGGPPPENESASLVESWGSDFRTRATERKIETFSSGLAAATARAEQALARRVPGLDPGQDVLIVNTSSEAWDGDLAQVPLRIEQGRLHRATLRGEPASALPADSFQVEVLTRYRDGSLRDVVLVLEPRLDPGESLSLALVPARDSTWEGPEELSEEGARTASVEAAFLPHRGGALSWARFPGVDPAPLVGTLPHGSFDAIAHTPDFYSGHVLAVTDQGRKCTDLGPCDPPQRVQRGPVRTSIVFRGRWALGSWSKLYRLYEREPRLDMVHILNVHEARLRSLRLATVTLLPDSFQRESLGFATVNGGTAPERFDLSGKGVRVSQPEAVSQVVSARSCLGATEGWVSIGDDRRGIAVLLDRSESALAPMLEFDEVDDRFFLRLQHSAAETDETTVHFLRGVKSFGVVLQAHRNDLDRIGHQARRMQHGLAYRTETEVGITRGL